MGSIIYSEVIQSFPTLLLKNWKMKCIALIATLVVAALAEPEPFYGLGYGYGGYGLPVTGYASRPFGVSPYGRTHAASAPVVTRVATRPVTPIVKSAPIVAKAPIVKTVAPTVPIAAPVSYASTATVKAVPVVPSTSQHHKQDEFGNFEYGYDNVNSAKIERGNAGNAVSGTYTVKDIPPRTVSYVADALGFRVTQDLVGRKKRSLAYPFRSYANAYATPLRYSVAAPVAAAVAPVTTNAVPVSTSVVQPIAAAPSTSQPHKQDEFGNYEYGYANINSAKQEAGNVHTGVAGSYSYRDAFGIERSLSYVADGLGFRVTPTHLRGKRSVAVVPSQPATRPAQMMVIQYTPGHATGYRLF